MYRLPVVKSMSKRQTELVTVEYGNDIVEVTPALVKAVTADLAAVPEYNGSEMVAFEPETLHPGRSISIKWME